MLVNFLMMTVLQNCGGFYFNQIPGFDQSRYTNHRSAGFDFSKCLTMCSAIFFPAANVRYEHSCSNYIF